MSDAPMPSSIVHRTRNWGSVMLRAAVVPGSWRPRLAKAAPGMVPLHEQLTYFDIITTSWCRVPQSTIDRPATSWCKNMKAALLSLMVAGWLAFPPAPVLAASGPPGHEHGGVTHELLGIPAPRGRGRVVKIQMNEYGYGVKSVTVKAGETIRFMITNNGILLHEFNINTAAEHAAHRPMMAMMMRHGMITPERVVSLTMTMPDGSKMTHVEPNSVLVEPGKSAEISWKFTQAGELQIGCNIPDHTESGMVAVLKVVRR